MALDKSQRAIVNSLLEKPQTIRQLLLSTGLSDTTIRQNLKVLVKLKELDMDTERQPYLYSVSEHSTEFQNRAAIDKAKAQLKQSDANNVHPFIKPLRMIPKETWADAANTYASIADAIRELEADGELIDTL